jgi:hypothetical protein
LKKVVIAVVIISLALTGLAFAMPQIEKEPALILAGSVFPGAGSSVEGALSNMTAEEVMAQMQRAADESYFSFKINARPVFEDGKSKGTLMIENPPYNVYPMVVQIVLEESGEIIYDSGGILPGYHIDSANLLKELPKGEHAAVANLNAYDPESKEWLGRQSAKLIIKVNA